MSNLRYSDSIVVARSPEDLYDMVSDMTRMGEWSPVCRACWWDEGDGLWPGAWFAGQNELPERTWQTRSQVVAADRGREFAFVVGGSWVRWGYTFTPVDGGTRVTVPLDTARRCPMPSPGTGPCLSSDGRPSSRPRFSRSSRTPRPRPR